LKHNWDISPENAKYRAFYNVLPDYKHYKLHLLKDKPEDCPTIGPKHVAGIIT
jgi:hypothetical protein